MIFLSGAAVGVVGFLVAKALIPGDVANPAAHDLALAHRIGFVFPALAGLCVGWLQRSLARMVAGMMIGSLVGYMYATLCGSEFEFLTNILGFPCFCGGVFAGFYGSHKGPWLAGFPARFVKGLVAGLLCGFVYLVAVNPFAAYMILLFQQPTAAANAAYSKIMWKAGTPAMGLAGGVFLLLFCWAIGLRDKRKAE